MARSTSSITVFFLTLFTITAFAQKNAPQDDNTNSPVAQQQMQEQARERAQRSQVRKATILASKRTILRPDSNGNAMPLACTRNNQSASYCSRELRRPQLAHQASRHPLAVASIFPR